MAQQRGRFAPSPSGRMHLGNIYCALMSWLYARSSGGQWILRIEDLDPSRSRESYARQIEDDLHWLGLTWDEGPQCGGEAGPYYQSLRTQRYRQYMQRLQSEGLVYPCFCTRGQLHAPNAPHAADGTLRYSGRCAALTPQQCAQLMQQRKPAYRLRMPQAQQRFTDGVCGEQCISADIYGDIIVRRSDGVFAYQLAVTADDADMHITQVVRGQDLLPSAAVQLAIYKMLGLREPQFYHIPLLCAPDGRRLCKRDESLHLGQLRSRYTAPQLLGRLAYLCGLQSTAQPCSAQQLLRQFRPSALPRASLTVPPDLF